jgi:hypothetical protein
LKLPLDAVSQLPSCIEERASSLTAQCELAIAQKLKPGIADKDVAVLRGDIQVEVTIRHPGLETVSKLCLDPAKPPKIRR